MSSDSEEITLHKCHHYIHFFSKLLARKTKLVLYWIIPLDMTLLYRYYHPTLENIWAHSLMLLLFVVAFYFYFYFVIEKSIFFKLQIIFSERKFTYLLWKSFFSVIIVNSLNKHQRLIQIKRLERIQYIENAKGFTYEPSVALTDKQLYISSKYWCAF